MAHRGRSLVRVVSSSEEIDQTVYGLDYIWFICVFVLIQPMFFLIGSMSELSAQVCKFDVAH